MKKNIEKSLNQWSFPECILYLKNWDFNAHLIRAMICQDDIGRAKIQSKDCHKNVTTKCKKAGVANRTKIFQSLRVNFVTITQHCRNFRTRFKHFQKLDYYSKEFKKYKWTELYFFEIIVHYKRASLTIGFQALHSAICTYKHITPCIRRALAKVSFLVGEPWPTWPRGIRARLSLHLFGNSSKAFDF